MFDRLKKAFVKNSLALASMNPQDVDASIIAWGKARGLENAPPAGGKGFAMKGAVGNRPYKLECGPSSRDFISGFELRARAEIKVNDNAAVLIMNRPLKDELEKRAYEMYTDTLQTTADPGLPEEMRWLAMYPEADWSAMPRIFKNRYVVLSDKLEHAVVWVDPELMDLLMHWPAPGPDDAVPFILMLLRGKAYLRMQHTPGDLPTLEHATAIFTKACTSAMSGLAAESAA